MDAGERIAAALEAIAALMQAQQDGNKTLETALLQQVALMENLHKRSQEQDARNIRADELTQQFSVYLQELQDRTRAHEEQIQTLSGKLN